MVIIGSRQNLMIDFNLTNIGDSAYMTTLVLAYPNMLLFNKFTMKMERSVCENKVKENISYLKCRLLHPVFKKNTQLSKCILPIVVFSENDGTQVLDFKTYHFGIKNALKLHGENKHNATIYVKVTITVQAHHTKMTIKSTTPKCSVPDIIIWFGLQERCVVPANAEVKVEVMIIKLSVEKSLPAIIGGSIGGFLFLAIII
ncbi:unnamed protein product, partial [Coregonus sp. 'balchen']